MSRRLFATLLATIWLAAAPSAGQESAVLSEMDFDRSTPVRMIPVCGFPDLAIPPEAKIYAVGGYRGGRNLGWKIGHSHQTASLSKVVVNSPDEPVVLMLGAYDPTIWEVGWTEGTVILAVLVSGYETQGLSGLPPHIPTLVSSVADRGPCPSFFISAKPEQRQQADELALKAFQRRPDEYLKSADVEYVVAGRPLAAGQKAFVAQALVREDFELPGAGLTGRAALEASLRAGLIRPATATEMNRWRVIRTSLRRTVARVEGLPEPPPPADDYGLAGLNADNAFVIVDDQKFYCPEGLPELITLFLPAGLRAPQGRLELCRLFFLDDGRCRGQACPR